MRRPPQQLEIMITGDMILYAILVFNIASAALMSYHIIIRVGGKMKYVTLVLNIALIIWFILIKVRGW